MRWTTGEATRNIAWAVMVFGSSRGGGKAVLGTTGGVFAGRVTLDGGSVYLADGRLPIDESQIPAEGRVAWFDPSADGALEMSSHTQRPLAVRVVHGRGNDGLDKAADYFHLRGTYSSGYDRRPWLCEGSRGGAATKWIDFSDRYPGVVLNGSADNKGNTLRIFKNPAPSTESASTNPNKVNIRSAFVALDSSNGGGMPLIDTLGANELIKSRMPTRDYNTPIWTNTTAAAVKNGVTRLDGVTVNGTTRGYTGHPEVLSLETTANVPISYFGWYGGDDAEYPNAEILGEILLFDTILPADVRADVEAYLMRKWTGRVPAGYADLRGATVAGSGTVRAAGLSALPRFDPSFTGTLELVGDE